MADYEADDEWTLEDFPNNVFPTIRHTNKWDHKGYEPKRELYTLDEDLVMAYNAMLSAIKEMWEGCIRPKLHEQGWEEPDYTIYRDENNG